MSAAASTPPPGAGRSDGCTRPPHSSTATSRARWQAPKGPGGEFNGCACGIKAASDWERGTARCWHTHGGAILAAGTTAACAWPSLLVFTLIGQVKSQISDSARRVVDVMCRMPTVGHCDQSGCVAGAVRVRLSHRYAGGTEHRNIIFSSLCVLSRRGYSS